MSQSRKASAAETAANIAIGYAVAIASQEVIFPMFGIHQSLSENMTIGACFTVVSIVRSYALRRLFNSFHRRSA